MQWLNSVWKKKSENQQQIENRIEKFIRLDGVQKNDHNKNSESGS